MFRPNAAVSLTLALALAGLLAASATASSSEITVKNDAELRKALHDLRPGTTVLIEPGKYRGNISIRNVSGTKDARIVVRGKDPKKPPVFSGGKQALHLVDCNFLTLAHIEARGFSSNGINVDDGGSIDTPSRGIIIDGIRVLDTGPKGNHDALKMSGVDDFVVRNSRFEGWGGSAIDMVGCHKGVVEKCHFQGKKGFSQSNAIQMKGGTTEVLVHRSFFKDVGQRDINLGGSTGLKFFRPKVGNYEAKNITVAGNRFVGSMAVLAWVTAQGGRVHHNTIYCPQKWVLRILQETRDKRFKPSHGGSFENNLVVFDSKIRTFVNVGSGTSPESFTFRANAWFDKSGKRQPRLPTPETDGVYGVDPKLEKPGTAAMKCTEPKLRTYGADAYKPATKPPDAKKK
jgi:hypothetical protein